MRFTLFAASGFSELKWFYEAMLMGLGLLVIAVTALLSLRFAWRSAAVAAGILMGAFCWSFLPWYCFAPFSSARLDDPDVVHAVNRFRVVGVAWVATLLLVVVSLVAAKIRKRPRQPATLVGADPPQTPPVWRC
jgi:hypothetical protein